MTGVEGLGRLRLPTNPVTDDFGLYRDWAPKGDVDPVSKRPGWYPGAGYRPIHYGTDFSARPEDAVRAPGHGFFRYDAAAHMVTFLPGDVAQAMIYLLHVTREHPMFAHAVEWMKCGPGALIAFHETGGVYAPHLHLELAVSELVFWELVEAGRISGERIPPMDTTAIRASESRLDTESACYEVLSQIQTDSILCITDDAILRSSLPAYKTDPSRRMGNVPTWIIDARKVMGHET